MLSGGSGQNQPQVKETIPAAPAANVVSTFQTTEFIEDDPGELLSFPEAGTAGLYEPIAPAIDLAQFLKRPVRLASYVWSTGWANPSINPWHLFLTNAAIADKIKTFVYIRGKLKLKIVINGSPFHYGAMRAVYEPLWGYTTTRVNVNTPYGSALIPWSQMPGVFIYPQQSAGGEIECPFFYFKDYLPLTLAAPVQWMGRLRMIEYVPLRSANGAFTNGVTISIYGWMEDVQLSGFTTSLIMQSDEYDEAAGPISKPAAILSNWAQHLEKVPVIGRFATATKIGSSAISKIASLFGWSNVPVVSSVMPFKNLPFHDLASAEISQPISKFTLDPKAELSVSPYMVGLNGEDELAVSSLVQRETYLTSFVWNVAEAPDTLYFSALVNPLLYDRGTQHANGTYGIQMSPLCAVARMFRYWRGDIIFTFRVIASKFHRGRLRIHWTPYSAPTLTGDMSHLAMTKIIDIEDAIDVEFRVPYLQPVPFCEHTHQGDVYTANRWSTSSVLAPSVEDDNGSLVVRCLNNLSAPVDTAPVSIMVFVRGGENMQFANPIDLTNRFSYIEPQSGLDDELLYQSDMGVEEKTRVDPNTYMKNWGEPILSVRSLLRRSSLVDIKPLFLSSDPNALIQEQRYPMTKYQAMPGYSVQAFGTAKSVNNASVIPFSYANMTHFSWIIPCFLGLRGSVRWHFNVINHYEHGPDSVAVYRDPGVVVTTPSLVSLVSSTSTTENLYSSNVFNRLVNSGSSGVALTNYESQTGLSVEMPYMIPYKFYVNNWTTWHCGSSTDKSNADGYKVIIRINENNANQDMALERYSSIGTDFNAHFFLCVPTMFYNPSAGLVPA